MSHMLIEKLRAAAIVGAVLVLGAGAGAAAPARRTATALPPGWQASHVRPLAHVALPGPRAFKLTIKQANGRWYLFVGQGGGEATLSNVGRGFNVIDVTDPNRPFIVANVPLDRAGGQITLHDNLLIAAIQTPYDPGAKHPREAPFSDTKGGIHDLAAFYDVSDPTKPRLLSTWRTAGWATHRNVYPGGKYAFMASWIAGYRGQAVLTILDVSDPVHPKEVGHWWRPGQRDDEGGREPPNGFHGPVTVSPDGKMLTMAYTPGLVNLDFTDPAHPKVIGDLHFSPLPEETGAQSLHTGLPLPNGMVHVSIEAAEPGCDKESAAWAALVDNRDPKAPRLVSYYPRPEPPPGAPYKSFCDKGGRVGPHNVNAEIHLPDAQAPGDLIFMTYFTAGLRVFNIADPRMPREVGWFLPAIGAWETGERGPEDVLVDTRGYIYTSTGASKGVWILKYDNPTGPQVPIKAR